MHNLVNIRDFLPVGDDWAPAFKGAIDASIAGGHGGVFVPANKDPYTVRKPDSAVPVPSIDLRTVTDFTLMGDGYGSIIKMIGSGRGGSWAMIHIGGHAANVTVRDLFLDGNREFLTELDEGEQTHLVRLGGSRGITGGADNVKILNCTLTRADGDGVAILPISAPFGSGEEVSNVRIAFCEFIDNNRSGISNQRSTELIEILYNYFEGTSDQDIDFEPTGGELATGPRRYVIMGNTIVHSTRPAAITLSGVSPDIPASNNILAYNQIYGGGLGMVDAEHTSIVGNYIEGGLLGPGPVVRFTEKVSGVRFSNNHVVRPAGALPGSLLLVTSSTSNPSFASSEEFIDPVNNTFTRKNHGLDTGAGPVRVTTSGTLPAGLTLETDYWVIRVDADVVKLAASLADALAEIPVDITDVGEGVQQMTLIHFPRGVDVHDNRFHTYVAVAADDRSDEEGAIVFRNAQECSFRNNEVHSYSGTTIRNAVNFHTSAAILVTVKGWDVSGNRIRGDARADRTGAFAHGVILKPIGVGVEDIRITFNSFRGCTGQIFWTKGDVDSGSYDNIPIVIGNNGDGVPFEIREIQDVPVIAALLIGGNDGVQPAVGTLSGSGAIYCGSEPPTISAGKGSIYMRTGESPGAVLFVNTDGNTGWQPVA